MTIPSRPSHGCRMSATLPAVALCWAGAPTPALRAAAWTGSTTADERNIDGVGSLWEAIGAAAPGSAVDACSVGDGIDPIRAPAGTDALALAGEDVAATGDTDMLAPTVFIVVGALRRIIGADTFGVAGEPRWFWHPALANDSAP